MTMRAYRDAPPNGRSLRARLAAALRGPLLMPALFAVIPATLWAPWVAVQAHVARPAVVMTGWSRLGREPKLFIWIGVFAILALVFDVVGRTIASNASAAVSHLAAAGTTYLAYAMFDLSVTFDLFWRVERQIGGWLALSLAVLSLARSLYLAVLQLLRCRRRDLNPHTLSDRGF
jgi:hypothetical protein